LITEGRDFIEIFSDFLFHRQCSPFESIASTDMINRIHHDMHTMLTYRGFQNVALGKLGRTHNLTVRVGQRVQEAPGRSGLSPGK
jgi:hypothetical protein